MAIRLNYYWRLLGTALGFLLFGIGGLFLAVALLPLVWLVKREAEQRMLLGKRAVQFSFRLFLGFMQAVGVAEFRFNEFQRISGRSGLLIVANHPTLIDVICLVANIDNADCVVKRALKYNPATAGPIKAAGYLTNQGGESLIMNCAASIKAGYNLIIFPEGTRSIPGQPMEILRGAANIAIEGGFDITPIHISCRPPTLTKNDRWYNIPAQKIIMELTVLDDVKLDHAINGAENRSVAARRLSEQLKFVFQEKALHD